VYRLTIHANVNGAYRNISEVYVTILGTIRPAPLVYTNVDGIWRESFQSMAQTFKTLTLKYRTDIFSSEYPSLSTMSTNGTNQISITSSNGSGMNFLVYANFATEQGLSMISDLKSARYKLVVNWSLYINGSGYYNTSGGSIHGSPYTTFTTGSYNYPYSTSGKWTSSEGIFSSPSYPFISLSSAAKSGSSHTITLTINSVQIYDNVAAKIIATIPTTIAPDV
jgi:hypothetical protein